MLDSFQIAALLKVRGFVEISASTRTKAHGYLHPQMTRPVYVKVGGPKGALKTVKRFPLVIDEVDVKRLLALGPLPDGVTLEAGRSYTTGFGAYRTPGPGTPSGRELKVSDSVALDRLLRLLLDDDKPDSGPASPPTAQ